MPEPSAHRYPSVLAMGLAAVSLAACSGTPTADPQAAPQAPQLPALLEFGEPQWKGADAYAAYIASIRDAVAPAADVETSVGMRRLHVSPSIQQKVVDAKPKNPKSYTTEDFVGLRITSRDQSQHITFLMRKDDLYVIGLYNEDKNSYIRFETPEQKWRDYPFPADRTGSWTKGTQYPKLCEKISSGRLEITDNSLNSAVKEFADKGNGADGASLCQPAVLFAEAARFAPITEAVQAGWPQAGKATTLNTDLLNYMTNWSDMSKYAFWKPAQKSSRGEKDRFGANDFNVGPQEPPQYVHRTAVKPIVFEVVSVYNGNGSRAGRCGGVFVADKKGDGPCAPAPGDS
ncbi:ribosome-inactivating family protein [Kitasatospora sp. NPDC056273]|uniref:ribosome-inactivating family protein n=1 Tax=Kitasatospora sp. NPDC056273 TaxID=3345769 RepID=UPI0035DF7EF3